MEREGEREDVNEGGLEGREGEWERERIKVCKKKTVSDMEGGGGGRVVNVEGVERYRVCKKERVGEEKREKERRGEWEGEI